MSDFADDHERLLVLEPVLDLGNRSYELVVLLDERILDKVRHSHLVAHPVPRVHNGQVGPRELLADNEAAIVHVEHLLVAGEGARQRFVEQARHLCALLLSAVGVLQGAAHLIGALLELLAHHVAHDVLGLVGAVELEAFGQEAAYGAHLGQLQLAIVDNQHGQLLEWHERLVGEPVAALYLHVLVRLLHIGKQQFNYVRFASIFAINQLILGVCVAFLHGRCCCCCCCFDYFLLIVTSAKKHFG